MASVYYVVVFHPCLTGQCTPMDVRYLADQHVIRDDGSLIMHRKGRFVARMKPGEWSDLRIEAYDPQILPGGSCRGWHAAGRIKLT